MFGKSMAFLLALFVSGVVADDMMPPMMPAIPKTVVDIAAGSADHATLVTALSAAGLVETLQIASGNYSVFAPTDEAFAELGNETLLQLLDPTYIRLLQDILLYHVAIGQYASSDLKLNQELWMYNFELANITSIDPYYINDALIGPADLFAENGVVHVIDKVLLPWGAVNSIVSAAISLPEVFSTLVDLVVAANLTDTLAGPGPFTLFAPTNEAFAKLDNETVAFLLSPNGTETLTDILLYHVASGIYHSEDIADGSVITMANGDDATITITKTSGTEADNTTSAVSAAEAYEVYYINNATIVDGDYLVNNGIIHIIDSVILPPGRRLL